MNKELNNMWLGARGRLMVAELEADKKCSVNVLLKESWEVKAGKGVREPHATCVLGQGGRGKAEGPASRSDLGRSQAHRPSPASGCGARSRRGADPGRQAWGRGGRRERVFSASRGGGGDAGPAPRAPRPPPGLTQHEVGQLRVFQVVHHDHFPREVVAHREEELGLGGRRAVHDAQVVLAQKGQRRHSDAFELALQLLGWVHVARGRGQHRRRPPAAGEQGAEPG